LYDDFVFIPLHIFFIFLISFSATLFIFVAACGIVVYYESIKREPKIRGIYELGSTIGWEKATDEPMFNGSGERQPTNGSQRILTVPKVGYCVSSL